jgi:hypothetical protein
MTHYSSNHRDNRIGGRLLGKAEVADPETAFRDAIAAGILSEDLALVDYRYDNAGTAGTSIYVGNWMYMYSMDGFDYFKNIAHRHYITSKIPEGR